MRHGESEGNVDETVYRTTPDHRVRLTAAGRAQARLAGEELAALVGDTGKIYMYVSPYTRTLETARELAAALGRGQLAGVREEPRIREQDFGNLQDDAMPLSKRKRVSFGRFFYRFPDGESAADVYDRVTTFRETIRNDFDTRFTNESDLSVIIVGHGISLRVFLQRWYKWSSDDFERLQNPSNSECIIMERGSGGRYSLAIRHDEAWLRAFGLSEAMIADQVWQARAMPGDLNPDWPTSNERYFDDLDDRLERRARKNSTTSPRPPPEAV